MRLLESLGRWLWRGLAVALVGGVLLIAFGLTVAQWVWDHLIWPVLPRLALILVCGLVTVWLTGRIRRMRRQRHVLEVEHQQLVETMTDAPREIATWTWRPRR